MGARHYDPEIGRFLSTDPLMELFPDQSPYSYAYNSPLTWKDPSGLAGETDFEAANLLVQNFFDTNVKKCIDILLKIKIK